MCFTCGGKTCRSTCRSSCSRITRWTMCSTPRTRAMARITAWRARPAIASTAAGKSPAAVRCCEPAISGSSGLFSTAWASTGARSRSRRATSCRRRWNIIIPAVGSRAWTPPRSAAFTTTPAIHRPRAPITSRTPGSATSGAPGPRALWVRNLFDARYAQNGFYFGLIPPNYPNQSFLQLGDPRQVGVTVNYQLHP